MGGGNIHV